MLKGYLRHLLFKVSYSNTKFEKRNFIAQNDSTKEHLEGIGANFLDGYHLALKSENVSSLVNELEKNNDEFLGFRYEGAAMAYSIFDLLNPFGRTKLNALIHSPEGNDHIYMLHVGAGWAFARIPSRIEKNIERFHPIYRWLVIDGYGFHQAFFKTKKYVLDSTEPTEFKNPYAKQVFYQGMGRCLWFIECADPERIANRISTFPFRYKADLWSGVGLACAYAGGADEETILRLKELARDYLPHLSQGVVFAAKARERAGIITHSCETTSALICGISVREAASIADNCLSKINTNLSSDQQYESWRNSIRGLFTKKKDYESILEEVSV